MTVRLTAVLIPARRLRASRLPKLNLMRTTIGLIAVCAVLDLPAATNNLVRLAPPSKQSVGFDFERSIPKAVSGIIGSAVAITNIELVAWSASVDHLDSPPRLSEDAIVT